MRDAPPNLPLSFLTKDRGFLGSCLLPQFIVSLDVLEAQADIVRRGIQDVSHLPLGQPDGLAVRIQPHLDGLVGVLLGLPGECLTSAFNRARSPSAGTLC